MLQILLVEDDEVDRIRTRRLLRRSGLEFRMDEAAGAEAALDVVRRTRDEQPYDCVLLDHRLPDGTAFEVLSAIRECALAPHLPVIVLTGMDDSRVAVDAMKLGAFDYLRKDKVQPDNLRASVERAVSRGMVEEERRRYNERLTQLSFYDALTGLPNRQLFFDRLEQQLSASGRSGKVFALLMMDVNLFKQVNDTLGHEAGDHLLREIGNRLREGLRDSDTVARLGGDEFAALLPSTDSVEGAMVVAEKLAGAVSQPAFIDDNLVNVGLSVGVAMYPEHGDEARALLRCADKAMYLAKAGSGNCEVFSDDLQSDARRPTAIAAELGRLDFADLTLHYQPKINLEHGAVTGVEALVRWQHPELGLLPPMEFIPAAERLAVIRPLTLAIIDAALRQSAHWAQAGRGTPVSVNLSARLLDDTTLPELVAQALEAHGTAPRDLILEVTETGIMANPRRAAGILGEISEQGVRISIDDFGTGYSSLKYLREFPIDEIKIDRLFIDELHEGSRDASIVHSVVELSRGFGVNVVAEGVACRRVEGILRGLGCREAQGFLYSRPLAPDALARWLDARGSTTPSCRLSA